MTCEPSQWRRHREGETLDPISGVLASRCEVPIMGSSANKLLLR